MNPRHFIWLPLFACFFPFLSNSQTLPNYSFQNPVVNTCPFDTTGATLFWKLPFWEAYQTFDSTWDGPQDSSCISVSPGAVFSSEFHLNEVNHNLPIYLRNQLDSSNMVLLDTNSLYRIMVSQALSPFNSGTYQTGGGCYDNLCTGMGIGIEIPDSGGTGTNSRWYQGFTNSTGQYFEFCFPTEKFINHNFIKEAFLKYSIDMIDTNSSQQLGEVSIMDMTFETTKLNRIDANYFNGSTYEYWMSGFPQPNYMCMYRDSTYPDANHLSFVDVYPLPNSTTQETIDIYVDAQSFLIHQPYAQLRGGLVLGDTVRHFFNLINNGGTVCMPGIAEIMVENGNSFMYRSGNVNFEGRYSCMLFGRGGKLVLPENTIFHFGGPGRGIMALRPGGIVQIGNGSELVIHNMLSLKEYRTDSVQANLSVTLNKGSKLSFAPGSSITTMGSAFPATKLKVYLKGGVLDDSQLDEASKALIVRVYENPQDEMADNLIVYGNPFDERLEISIKFQNEIPLRILILDARGERLYMKKVYAQQGINFYDLNTENFPPGIYTLKLESPSGTVSKKVVKINN